MKKHTRFLALVICIALIALLIPATASAGPESIGVSARLSPGTTGTKGGDVSLRASISNMNEADIDWVDFTINTATPQTKRWQGAQPIYAFSSGTAFVDVHLAPEDLNKDIYVTIAINFDSDANPDKVVIDTVRANSQDNLVTFTASPSSGDFNVGDSVTVTHEMTNEMAASIYNVAFSAYFLGNENQDLVPERVAYFSSVGPGDPVQTSTTYTLTEADVGIVGASYSATFNFLGETYTVSRYDYSYNVLEPFNPEFSATLSAPGGEPVPGDTVSLHIEIRNTGNRGFGSFIVRDGDGTRVAAGGSAGPGETIGINVPFIFSGYGEWDVAYTVIGDFGLDDLVRHTNTLHLALTAPPTETPMPSPTAVPTVSPASGDASETEAPATPVPSASETAAPAPDAGSDQLVLYIIIGALGAIILAGAVAITLLMRKRKSGEPKKKKPEKEK